ncbi:hypothetical protein G9A89_019697 [Geosiphon pyriformis]|nr:hypothetical protein G9A89_019697 [Geosiphon pyriformis]
MKLFCVKFASQVSLKAVFLVELTSFVRLTTLKIVKFLVVSKSDSFFAAVVLHNVSLNVSATNIKTAFSVFGVIIYVVLKPTGIWQYVVSVLVSKDSVQILFLVNQQETIVSHDRFKAKLVNLFLGCTAFKISDMVSQIGGRSCFILQSSDSGCCFHFALIDHLAIDYKVALLPYFKAPKMFKSHFVGSLSYVKASIPLVISEFPLLVAAAPPVAVVDSLVFSQLASLEFDLAKLSVLVDSIVKPVDSMVKVFEQFVNGDLVLSFALGLRVNEVLVYISIFSRAVGKLEREVVTLKTECGFENINMFGPYVSLSSFDDDMFFNLMSLWKHESATIKTDAFKTAE